MLMCTTCVWREREGVRDPWAKARSLPTRLLDADIGGVIGVYVYVRTLVEWMGWMGWMG